MLSLLCPHKYFVLEPDLGTECGPVLWSQSFQPNNPISSLEMIQDLLLKHELVVSQNGNEWSHNDNEKILANFECQLVFPARYDWDMSLLPGKRFPLVELFQAFVSLFEDEHITYAGLCGCLLLPLGGNPFSGLTNQMLGYMEYLHLSNGSLVLLING